MKKIKIINKDNSTKEFDILDSNKSLYLNLKEQGLELPHGCLAGSCSACRIEVLEGSENLKKISAVESNTIEALIHEYNLKLGEEILKDKTIRLSCRAIAQDDIVIKILPKINEFKEDS